MINYFKKRSLIFSILIVALTTSCITTTSEKHVAYGDALIHAIQQNDSIVYTVKLFAYSWNKMDDVLVYAEADSTPIVLDSLNYQYTFSYLPKKSFFSTALPTASKYTFDILFQDGEELVVVDYLDAVTIDPAVISELKFDHKKRQISLKWNAVRGAQYYKVLLIDEENVLAFETELLDKSVNETPIDKYTYGWFPDKQPEVNQTFKVAIYAYLFEPVPSSFDIQCISINDQYKIEWLMDEE